MPSAVARFLRQANSPVVLSTLHPDRSYGLTLHSDNDLGLVRPSNLEEFACYGAYRLETYIESSQYADSSDGAGVERLFKVRTFLRDIELSLIEWALKAEAKSLAKEQQSRFTDLVSSTKALLVELLGLQAVEIDLLKSKVRYLELDAEDNLLRASDRESLGSGYRALLGLVGDMIIRLRETQPNVTDIKEMEGIVLIDEVELHLHPKWQRELPSVLTKYFPKVQFVASTHSPIPILGAPEGSVFIKVDRSRDEGITATRLVKLEEEIKNLLPNAVLTSNIFGLEHLSSKTNKSLTDIDFVDDYDDLRVVEERREILSNLDSSIFPDDLFVNH